jgi:hypothetical protein
MYRRKPKCSDEEYMALQKARKRAIDYKILIRSLERDVEELRRVGMHERALKYEEARKRLLEDAKYWEEEVKELTIKCFGKEFKK